MVDMALSTEQVCDASAEFFRLDPYKMAERLRYAKGDMQFTIDRTGVSVKMKLPKSGLPLAFGIARSAFKGIAARAVENADGSQTVSLELHHTDPDLCVKVLVADNLDDIAADWHSWSRLMKLPMLIVDADGMSKPVRDELGMVMLETPTARRKRITGYKPRPWFLKRRKMGVVGNITRLTANEIIARV
jgi:hypothetical protein